MMIVAIIQARMESTRLPGKVLKKMCGKTVLQHIVARVSNSVNVNKVVIATSTNDADNAIEKMAQENNIICYRGSQNNVLERFAKCAEIFKPDIIVRLTGDNALIDFKIIDQGIQEFISDGTLDYLKYRDGLPLGMAVEIFKYSALMTAYHNATNDECLEHVTPYLYKNPDKFKIGKSSCNDRDLSNLRWTIDTQDDFELISLIYEQLYPKHGDNFEMLDIIEAYNEHPEWQTVNNRIEQVKVNYNGESN